MFRSLRVAAILCAFPVAQITASEVEGRVAAIHVEEDDVIRLTDAMLRKAGFAVEGRHLRRLRLRLGDDEVPVLVEPSASSGEGSFVLSFLGRHRRGTLTHVSPHGASNVYRLDLASSPRGRLRLSPRESGSCSPRWPRRDHSVETLHVERDRRLVDFGGAKRPAESWYWEEVRSTDREPVTLSLALPGAVTGQPLTLRVHLMGYTDLPEAPDHDILVSWNGWQVGRAVWDGRAPFTFETQVQAGLLQDAGNLLTLDARSPGRVDVVLLDWVEMTFSRRNDLGLPGQLGVTAGPGAATVVHSTGARPASVLFWSTSSQRILSARWVRDEAELCLAQGGGARYVAKAAGAGGPPRAIIVRQPEALMSGGADFIIVSAPHLVAAARRLAEARGRGGLVSRVVLIDDIYDGFSGGLPDPAALRAFLLHAREHWRPRPSYLLLMGEATWDPRGLVRAPQDARGVRAVTPAGALVPTLRTETGWGSGASDTLLVEPDGGGLPDIAVGRIPAASPDEAHDVVDKVLGGGNPDTPGDALAVADHVDEHRKACARYALAFESMGLGVEALCGEATVGMEVWERFRSSLERGLAFVVFVGHGSRDILQTGPSPDTSKNRDVITWPQIDGLRGSPRQPVLLALSCDVAPFDHPWADSLGERLLRMRGAGAAAVVAASRRAPPAYALAEGFLEALGKTGVARLGDAFLAALRNIDDSSIRNSYNLLGDPTMPVGQKGCGGRSEPCGFAWGRALGDGSVPPRGAGGGAEASSEPHGNLGDGQ